MRTVNHVAVAAAAGAAAHVGRAWSATLSGASNRLQRKTPSVAGVVIYTEGRNGQDRSLAATLTRLSAFLPTISFASLAGFNGVGRRIANEPVNEAEDLRNVSVVLDAVTGALQQLDGDVDRVRALRDTIGTGEVYTVDEAGEPELVE